VLAIDLGSGGPKVAVVAETGELVSNVSESVSTIFAPGGGAEQDPILPGRTSIKVPADYPPELYWKGQPPREEYNYVLVDVEPNQRNKFTLTRYRPGSAEPFATEALFT